MWQAVKYVGAASTTARVRVAALFLWRCHTHSVVLHLNAKRLDGISCLCVALTCYVLRPAGGAVERAVPAEEHRDPIRGEAGWLVHSHVRFPALSG